MSFARVVAIGALFCLGLVACRSGSPAEPTASLHASAEASANPMDAATQKMVGIASEHLAEQLDVSPDAIAVVRVQPAEWRDGSLGCPKPGVDYLEGKTPGYVMWLDVAGQEYEYHSDATKRVVVCPKR